MDDLRLVIFDMDGLLFDTERTSFIAMERLAKRFGYHYLLSDFKKIIGMSEVNARNLTLNIYGNEFIKVFDSFEGEFSRVLDEEGLIIKPGALKLLNTLDKKGIKKCIASSSRREVIEKYIASADLQGQFIFYLSGAELKNGKPHPEIFLEACRKTNVEPETSLVLEDSYNGFLAAINANIRCIIIPDLIEPNDEMKKKAYRICSDLGEVADLIETGNL